MGDVPALEVHTITQARMRELAERVRLHFRAEPPSSGTEDPDVAGAELVLAEWGQPQLDYAILRIPRRPQSGVRVSRTRLTIQGGGFLPANIPQHPNGGPLEIGIRANKVTSTSDTHVLYETDTQGGSSGSPVCDDGWKAWALHRADGNQGTQMAAILDRIDEVAPELGAEIASQGHVD
ncbi:MAG: trypsin-like peptidase domain-containing protein [Myxococcota bacterium]